MQGETSKTDHTQNNDVNKPGLRISVVLGSNFESIFHHKGNSYSMFRLARRVALIKVCIMLSGIFRYRVQGPIVRKLDSVIHRIVFFSVALKLPVVRYNLG